MNNVRRQNGWEIIGKQYGYPQCCIDEFLQLKHLGDGPRKLCGTGYIPCVECNKKTEQELIDVINANRTHPTPFPIETSDVVNKLWSNV